jgi:C4-dicarboxylate-specific signal transduction histidine kinase
VLLEQLDMYFCGVDHIEGRTVLIGKNGIEIPVYYTVNRLAEGLHLSSHVNLTEQERITGLHEAARIELARANRIATVGAFSASIAHELNQPVASMVMDAQTGLRYLQREAPDLAMIERILQRLSRSAERMAGIVRHTRDAIVAGESKAAPIDLLAMVEDTGELLERELRRSRVTLRIAPQSAVPPVLGDPVQLQQVLVNLVTNAAEAMREMPEARVITIMIEQRAAEMEVVVADTGPGIAPDHLEKLFQPFFTTKPTGVGMGLQICRSAIEAMGGSLTARNREHGGAAFVFTLPLAEAQVPA